MKPTETLHAALGDLLLNSFAHVNLDDALKDLPVAHRSIVPGGLPYSIWQLLEHIRIAQWDIVAFSKSGEHQSPKWPDEYWPKEPAPANEDAWQNCIAQIKNDRNAFINLIAGHDTDLLKCFTYGDGQNLLREAILIIDHNSYHVGQIVLIRRLLSDW